MGESSDKMDIAMDDTTTGDSSSSSHMESISNQRFNDNNQRHGDNSYGSHGSSVMIVNTNLLPFIQKLRDPTGKLDFFSYPKLGE